MQYWEQGDIEYWECGYINYWEHGDIQCWEYGDLQYWGYGDIQHWEYTPSMECFEELEFEKVMFTESVSRRHRIAIEALEP